MSELPGLGVWRPGVVVALCCVAAACSSTPELAPEVEERPPDAFGWVVGWERSPDYEYEYLEKVSAGSVVFTLEDGTTFTVMPSTVLSGGICDPLALSHTYGPCWVHVGLSPDRTTATWLRVFNTDGWIATPPGEVPVADRVYTIEPIAVERDGRLVLEDGTVLSFDRSRVEVVCLQGTLTIDEAIDRFNHIGRLDFIVDQRTGVVTQIDCRLPV